MNTFWSIFQVAWWCIVAIVVLSLVGAYYKVKHTKVDIDTKKELP